MAIGHSESYLEDNREALRTDWARVPIPANREAFEKLAALGSDVALLLDGAKDAREVLKRRLGGSDGKLAVWSTVDGGATKDEDYVVSIPHFGSSRGGWRPGSAPGLGDLFINDRVYLAGVPDAVWALELGGYPAIRKWLGYRDAKRRDSAPLTSADRDSLRQIVLRLAALLSMTPALDQAYRAAAEDPLPSDLEVLIG